MTLACVDTHSSLELAGIHTSYAHIHTYYMHTCLHAHTNTHTHTHAKQMAEATTLRLAPFCSALHGRSDAFDLFELEKEAITQVSYRVLRCRIPHTFCIHSAYINHKLFIFGCSIPYLLWQALSMYRSAFVSVSPWEKENSQKRRRCVTSSGSTHTHVCISVSLSLSLCLSLSVSLNLNLPSVSIFFSLCLYKHTPAGIRA